MRRLIHLGYKKSLVSCVGASRSCRITKRTRGRTTSAASSFLTTALKIAHPRSSRRGKSGKLFFSGVVPRQANTRMRTCCAPFTCFRSTFACALPLRPPWRPLRPPLPWSRHPGRRLRPPPTLAAILAAGVAATVASAAVAGTPAATCLAAPAPFAAGRPPLPAAPPPLWHLACHHPTRRLPLRHLLWRQLQSGSPMPAPPPAPPPRPPWGCALPTHWRLPPAGRR